jgi:hypothetical protein
MKKGFKFCFACITIWILEETNRRMPLNTQVFSASFTKGAAKEKGGR